MVDKPGYLPPALGECAQAQSQKWLNRNIQISQQATLNNRCWRYAVVAPARGPIKLPPGVSPEICCQYWASRRRLLWLTGYWPTQSG